MRKISTICKHLDAEYARIPAGHGINIGKRVRLERELVQATMAMNRF